MMRTNTRQAGFTLVELVVVLVLVGILAAVGMPRFFSAGAFEQWGFADELAASLRFAQKAALASGCDAQVSISATGYRVDMRSGCDSGAFSLSLQRPGGDGSGYQGSAPGSMTLTPLVVRFDGAGRPANAAGSLLTTAVDIAIAGRILRVEPRTGYVHQL